jgi:hypothetical protein
LQGLAPERQRERWSEHQPPILLSYVNINRLAWRKMTPATRWGWTKP